VDQFRPETETKNDQIGCVAKLVVVGALVVPTRASFVALPCLLPESAGLVSGRRFRSHQPDLPTLLAIPAGRNHNPLHVSQVDYRPSSSVRPLIPKQAHLAPSPFLRQSSQSPSNPDLSPGLRHAQLPLCPSFPLLNPASLILTSSSASYSRFAVVVLLHSLLSLREEG
jgi:hypothetical protein